VGAIGEPRASNGPEDADKIWRSAE
jgi:hypothetical protein